MLDSESESEVTQSCPTLCDPRDCSPPGSSVHGIFQARILEWAAISFSRGSSRPRDRTQVSRIVGRRSAKYTCIYRAGMLSILRPEAYEIVVSCISEIIMCVCQVTSVVSDSVPFLDCSPPGSSGHRVLQARILEWVTMPSSRDLPDPGIEPMCLLYLLHWQAVSLLLMPPGKSKIIIE